jgi:glycosyltransferase involved in cell wall biosynthesis
MISNINKAVAFEWIAEKLNDKKFKLSFILINSEKSYLKKYLIQNNIPVFDIDCKNNFNIPYAILKCVSLLRLLKPDVVHTHLFNANIIGLVSAKLVNVKKRIYTRHHSDYHHLYHPKAIKYDKFINYLATDIVAISQVVKDVLINLEKVSESKIHLIYHGFKLEDFHNCTDISIEEVRQKYNSQKLYPVIGVISRQTEWKGIQFIIPAFQKFLNKYPNALLVLANASGDFKKEIHSLLKLVPKKNYVEIEFENDIFSLYKLFDIFIHVPISKSVEAFGQTYVEALGSGTPSVFTISGIANEFIIDRENALVVRYQDSDGIYDAIIELINNPELSNKIINNGKRDVQQLFQLNQMINKLEDLYCK